MSFKNDVSGLDDVGAIISQAAKSWALWESTWSLCSSELKKNVQKKNVKKLQLQLLLSQVVLSIQLLPKILASIFLWFPDNFGAQDSSMRNAPYWELTSRKCSDAFSSALFQFLADRASNASQRDFLLKLRKLNIAWIALLEIVNQLQQQPYANPVGRTIFQKISYIFTEQGADTGFHFKQGSYGPFSSEVKDALSVLANANLINEQQLGRMTALRIGPEYESVRSKYIDQIEPFEKKINKAVDLFSRIKSTAQAEEVTTVLYAARKLKKDSRDDSVSEQDIYDYILDWKKDWHRNEKQTAIASAIRNLEMLGWLRLRYSDSLPMEDF
jgi:uncharacterized protein YwgA